jgi:hypothetical protein
MDGANGQTGGKQIAAVLFVLTAFIFLLACLIIFCGPLASFGNAPGA